MIITLTLLIIVAILISLLFILKRVIRSMKMQLSEQLSGVQKPIDISFVDKDITELASQINEITTYQKEQYTEIIRRENQLKEDVSNISHDLRTPLTSIIGYLQLLNKTELQIEQKEFVKTALSRSNELNRLINNFYDLSILEAKENMPDLKKLNLDNILADEILTFTEQFEEKAITPKLYFLSEPTFIIADEVMLKRVIYNLIQNAIRYGTDELQITVSASDVVLVEFKNLIKEEQEVDINRLFDKFYTADLSRSHSGTGLGLFIVKLLIEKMDGTVQAAFYNNRMCISLSFSKYIS